MPANGVRPSKAARLNPQQLNGRVYIGVDLPWRESIELAAKQSRLFDQILALAELPPCEEWPKILALSQKYGMPSVLRRARPSVLENNVAALLTALAFSNHRDWPRLIRDFFKIHSLAGGLPGRPHVHPAMLRDVVRGVQIEKLVEKLRDGFQIKSRAEERGRCGDNGEGLSVRLKSLGYDEKERKAILKGKTLQDAACRFYHSIYGGAENCELKAIQNSYATYKRLRRSEPTGSQAHRPRQRSDSQKIVASLSVDGSASSSDQRD
jgi:hypothetical protein